MCDEDWMPIGAIAAQVVKKAAPDTGGEAVSSAGTLAAGRQGRAHHVAGGGGTDNVIWVNFTVRSGAAQPEGPTWPPRRFRDRDEDEVTRAPSRITPATGGLGNALRAKT